MGMVLLGACLAISARSQTWDLASVFSLANNPNGTWSFGWEKRPGSSFNPYNFLYGDQKGIQAKGFWSPGWFGPVRAWCKERPDADQLWKQLPPPGFLPYPDHWVEANFSGEEVVKQAAGMWCYPDPFGFVGKNISATGFDGFGYHWEPGSVLLMPPGKPGQDAQVVARWTAPAPGLYLINTRFTGQRSQVDAGMRARVCVFQDGELLFSGKIDGFIGSASERFDDALGPKRRQDWSHVLSLAKGDTIDFAVGTCDHFDYGVFGVENKQLLPGVGLEVNISQVPYGQTKCRRWVAAKFEGKSSDLTRATDVAHYGEESIAPPFSFIYGGKPSAEFLGHWQVERSARQLDDQRTEHTVIFTDPRTHLVVRCVGVEYHDFPTVEWTVYIKNSGSKDTPILERIRPIDLEIRRGPMGEFLLHRIIGNRLLATTLKPHMVRQLGDALPYLNFELPGEGLIVVLSWPGDLACTFARDSSDDLHIYGGQADTHFKLHPGEEVRTPMIVIQFYNGDFVDAQNTWRRWMMAHNMPRPGGKPLEPQLSASTAYQYGDMTQATESNQNSFIQRYVDDGLKPDFWWMDAGWYPPNNSLPLWAVTGTWVPDKKRFPAGLRGITDYARARGIKSIVWFQPERVSPGTWLYEHHPEWLIGPDGGDKVFDFGNPAAWRWAVDYFSRFVKQQGIDIFRMDTNIGFTSYWRGHDAPDRQGITEIRHVEGYLAFLDAMLRKNPGLRIDHWRTDLETLRRSAPLILDANFDPIDNQCFNYRMNFWFPWDGLCSRTLDTYDFRSMMCTAVVVDWDLRNRNIDTRLGRRLIREWREMAPDYFGDYYPLSPYSFDGDAWMAWQFNRPKTGTGIVQAFRRRDCTRKQETFKLWGLDAGANYNVRNLDEKTSRLMTGRRLMEQGIAVTLAQKPSAVIFSYKRIAEDKNPPVNGDLK